ncbi:MAG: enoyl-CoA hydratase-related protein [Proteobacteria bacterium]|nr:enoyl-CoA hydratase-related protein [Pseudomonadota bacterium]
MAEETVTRALHDGVALLTLHRPQAKNAFNAAQWDALRTALDETRENEAVAAVVVTGAGSAFSAGQDLKELGGLDGGSGAAFPRFMQALVRFDKPLLAAINGVGVGIGATLPLHCDVVYMAESARLRFPFASLGLVPEAASSLLLQLAIGPRRAAEIFFTAEWIDAQAALELGLVSRVLPDAELLDATLGRAADIAANPVGALRAIKRTLLASRAPAVQAALDCEMEGMKAQVGTPEQIEAIQAFFEKRPPNFRKLRPST